MNGGFRDTSPSENQSYSDSFCEFILAICQKPGTLLGPDQKSLVSPSRLFYFYIFQKKIYRNIFWFSKFTVLYPYRPAGGRQGACRPVAGRQGLICKFKKNYLRGSPWREPAAPLAGGRGLTARQGGGRLPAVDNMLWPLDVF